ncbi:MAG: SOS response-associated peptidase [Saprospiraceae bacterium]|nr:SOS response-associated peptidase [Saprospiraceae bacterium]
MCGRSSLTKVEKEIEQRFNATFYSEELERYNPLPNYNVAPTHMHPVITSQDQQHIHLFRWGLIPFWAKDKNIGSKMINARMETLMEKPAFKGGLKSKRCIVPFDGFYEWKRIGKFKVPFRIVTTDQDIFTVAGIWDSWKDPFDGEHLYSFTLITMEPNKLMETIHDRMPAILLKENEKLWLDETLSPKESLQLLIPYPSEYMEAYQVSTMVNNVKENNPSLILPVSSQIQEGQSTLF